MEEQIDDMKHHTIDDNISTSFNVCYSFSKHFCYAITNYSYVPFSSFDPLALPTHICLVICFNLHRGYATCFCIHPAHKDSGIEAIHSVS